MRITSKGQVTIPVTIRNQFGFLPDTEIRFKVAGKKVVLERAKTSLNRGSRLIEGLRGKATKALTTDEIMAMTRGE